jgi:ribosomal protein L11 methylase PrmA
MSLMARTFNNILTSPMAVKIRVVASAQAACLIAPVLSELGGRGVHSHALEGGVWELVTWVEQESFRPSRLGRIKHLCVSLSRYLGDVLLDWEPQELSRLPSRAQKRFFGLFQVTPRLWVGPHGTKVELGEAQNILELEVGQAEHCGLEPASRSALLLLEELLSRERITRGLDVKAGTGLFSMAAALWGVERVLALDEEPHAVRVARSNLRRNQLAEIVRVRCIPLKKWGGLQDLVIAVASQRVLRREMTHILRRVCPGGWLLLGGLRSPHVEGFLSRCCPPFSLEARKKELWWETLLLRLRRPAGHTSVQIPGHDSCVNGKKVE